MTQSKQQKIKKHNRPIFVKHMNEYISVLPLVEFWSYFHLIRHIITANGIISTDVIHSGVHQRRFPINLK